MFPLPADRGTHQPSPKPIRISLHSYHNRRVDDVKELTQQLAELMDEFRLQEARVKVDDCRIEFRKYRRPTGTMMMGTAPATETAPEAVEAEPAVAELPRITGMPVSSPMTGIYYSTPSPSAPDFVKEGEAVMVGQVVALIEAMKVFNEIVAPMAGIVQKVVAKNGEVVNPGDPLLYIG